MCAADKEARTNDGRSWACFNVDPDKLKTVYRNSATVHENTIDLETSRTGAKQRTSSSGAGVHETVRTNRCRLCPRPSTAIINSYLTFSNSRRRDKGSWRSFGGHQTINKMGPGFEWVLRWGRLGRSALWRHFWPFPIWLLSDTTCGLDIKGLLTTSWVRLSTQRGFWWNW